MTFACQAVIFHHPCYYLSAKSLRPSSASTRAGDTDTLSVALSHRQQNGSVQGRQTGTTVAGGLGESVAGFHHAALYVLGEKTQMKVGSIVIHVLVMLLSSCGEPGCSREPREWF